MAEDSATSLPPEMPPQMPSGFDAPGFSGGISSTENDINRMFIPVPELDIPVPQYSSSMAQFMAAEQVPQENYLNRPNYDNMFSVVYSVTSQNTPQVYYTAGVIVDGTTVHNVPSGSTPGNLVALSPVLRAPIDANTTFWLNVMSNRSASKVATTKDSSAELSIPVARIVKGRNGFIQQLHRGAVFMGGGSGGSGQWQVKVTMLNTSIRQVRIECDPAGATVCNDKFMLVPITPAKYTGAFNLSDGESKYVVYLKYQYGFNYTTIVKERAQIFCEKYTEPTGNNKDMRYRVQKMLTDTNIEGETRQVIALLSFKCTGSGSNLVFQQAKTQITTTPLRQVWINGYWETNPQTGNIDHGAACYLDVSAGDAMGAFPTPA